MKDSEKPVTDRPDADLAQDEHDRRLVQISDSDLRRETKKIAENFINGN